MDVDAPDDDSYQASEPSYASSASTDDGGPSRPATTVLNLQNRLSSTAQNEVSQQSLLLPGGDWKVMWDYIQPFLIVHKGPSPPVKGWVRELLPLPRVRDVQYNATRHITNPFKDSKPRDVSAVIIQAAGVEAPVRCTRCQQGKGPFEGCIVLPEYAHSGALSSIISCANCFYHYGQTYCSHKSWASERAQRVLQTRPGLSAPPPPQAGIEEHLDQPDVSMIDENFPVGEPLSPDVNVNRNHNHRQEPLHNALDETPSSDNPTIPPHYKMAEPNRRYDMWPTEMISGQLNGQQLNITILTKRACRYKRDINASPRRSPSSRV